LREISFLEFSSHPWSGKSLTQPLAKFACLEWLETRGASLFVTQQESAKIEWYLIVFHD